MNRILWNLLLPALLGFALRAAEPPKLEELMGVIRTNLAGVSETEVTEAAVNGLLDHFRSRVFWVTNGAPAATPGEKAAPLAQTNVFDGGCGYLRVAHVKAGLAPLVAEAYRHLLETNQLKGLVLDLRFAEGDDFAEAGRVAALFVNQERPLLDWGAGQARATGGTNVFTLPLAMLVNGETRGAAEALAAALQATHTGLLIGSATAGQASVFQEFTLSTGQRLRIAVAEVKVGDGKPMPAAGLTPDIVVNVAPADERKYLEDPFKPLPGTGAAATRVAGANRSARLTEAELVRLHREGLDTPSPRPRIAEPPSFAPSRSRKPQVPPPPLVADPVLVRALDLLKGLAVVEARKP